MTVDDRPWPDQLRARLVDAPAALSRNANFAAFDDPRARRARRLSARLRALRDALRAGTARIVAAEARGVETIVLVAHDNGTRQVAHLDALDVGLLRQDDAIRAALDPATTGSSVAR